jgi:hypothetical protein
VRGVDHTAGEDRDSLGCCVSVLDAFEPIGLDAVRLSVEVECVESASADAWVEGITKVLEVLPATVEVELEVVSVRYVSVNGQIEQQSNRWIRRLDCRRGWSR